MGLARLVGAVRNYQPWDDFWYGPVAQATAAGVDVSPESTLGITAMWNGVHLIANALAMVPLRLYRRRRNGGRDEAREDPRFRIVHRRPNRWQTSFGWRQMAQGHLLLRGNTFAQKVLRGSGSLAELVPLHPTRMTVHVDGLELVYEYLRSDGTRRFFRASEILHVRGLSTDGLVGYCPVTVLRESLGAITATDTFAARFFRNQAQPRGVLQTKANLKDEQYERVRKQWADTHAGVDNAHKPAILEGGLEWHAVGFSAEDAQLIGSKNFNVQEAARILNIPPHKLKEMSRTTFNNIEHQSIEWVVDSIQPWAENWEQQLDADLLTEREQATMYFKFDLKALLRGDSAQRAAYFQARFNTGSITPNEIRALDEEDPIEGGDRAYVQKNLVPADRVDDVVTKEAAPSPAPAPPAGGEEEDGSVAAAARLRAFVPVLADAARRQLHREITAGERAARKGDWTQFRVWLDEYYGEAAGTFAQALVPLARAMAGVTGLEPAVTSVAVQAYSVAAAGAVIHESLTALRTAVRDTPPEELGEQLASMWESWRESRPDQVAEREVARAIEVFTPRATEAA